MSSFKSESPIYITRPLVPDMDKVMVSIAKVLNSKWLTNMGENHEHLENKLTKVLKVRNSSVINNGTTALLIALKALDLPMGSEVITTPFTFAATPHSISWNGLKPVFCDIDSDTLCIDPSKIRNLITDKTTAILAVHVYGMPCDVVEIEKIAQEFNLKVIYDAAHAFSTEIEQKSIGTFGDITMFSFHATKLFNSLEGGCLTYGDEKLKQKICNLRNCGINNEELVEEVGINGKMNEIQAAVGILNLDMIEEEKRKRQIVRSFYDTSLLNCEGIEIVHPPKNIIHSQQYYPILVKKDGYGISRDDLYSIFKQNNIFPRKYFYPICSDYDCYKNLPSSSIENLPVANKVKNEVLCLPFYGDLSEYELGLICRIIKEHKT